MRSGGCYWGGLPTLGSHQIRGRRRDSAVQRWHFADKPQAHGRQAWYANCEPRLFATSFKCSSDIEGGMPRLGAFERVHAEGSSSGGRRIVYAVLHRTSSSIYWAKRIWQDLVWGRIRMDMPCQGSFSRAVMKLLVRMIRKMGEVGSSLTRRGRDLRASKWQAQPRQRRQSRLLVPSNISSWPQSHDTCMPRRQTHLSSIPSFYSHSCKKTSS